MINKMDKYSIIKLKRKGSSFRQISKELGIDRKLSQRSGINIQVLKNL